MKYLLALFFTACATERSITQFPDLVRQIFIASESEKGLVTTRCSEVKGTDCLKLEYRKLDLEDAFLRSTLRSADFVCKFADKRYLFCADAPCIFHHTYKCMRTFLGACIKRVEVEERIGVDDIWKMSGIKCFSKDYYDYRRL